MPVIPSSFEAPWLLRNGHVQTLLPVLWPRRHAPLFQRERLELDDGDFLDLDWLRAGHPRLAILSHGLEGSSSASYILGMAQLLADHGWDVLAWNYRGCSGEMNRLPRSYHSGESQDLRHVIAHAAPACETLALIGFSLGGNITLKYLGEAPPHPKVRAAAAFGAPVDLASSAQVLDRYWSNHIYLRRFLSTLIAKTEAKAQRFPDHFDVRHIRKIRTFREFDDRYTAPLHGFLDAPDYWARASSKPLLPAINIPTLILNPRNDPFLPPGCQPLTEAGQNPWLHLEIPASGGHIGCIQRPGPTATWAEHRIAAFLAQSLSSTPLSASPPSGP